MKSKNKNRNWKETAAIFFNDKKKEAPPGIVNGVVDKG